MIGYSHWLYIFQQHLHRDAHACQMHGNDAILYILRSRSIAWCKITHKRLFGCILLYISAILNGLLSYQKSTKVHYSFKASMKGFVNPSNMFAKDIYKAFFGKKTMNANKTVWFQWNSTVCVFTLILFNLFTSKSVRADTEVERRGSYR